MSLLIPEIMPKKQKGMIVVNQQITISSVLRVGTFFPVSLSNLYQQVICIKCAYLDVDMLDVLPIVFFSTK